MRFNIYQGYRFKPPLQALRTGGGCLCGAFSGKQTGVDGMATLLLGCVLIAFAIWLWKGGMLRRVLASTCTVLALGGLASPLLKTTDISTQPLWQAYSPSKLAELRQQGKPVFINITADWCITCLANEKVTLNTEQVKQAIETTGTTYLKGDWTNRNPEITKLLKQYGRNGIPLYLAYPANSLEEGIVLPQILTIDTVVTALTNASKASKLADIRHL